MCNAHVRRRRFGRERVKCVLSERKSASAGMPRVSACLTMMFNPDCAATAAEKASRVW